MVDIVSFPGARSMRVVMADWNLGTRSRVVLRSVLDGHEQHLDAKTIERWSVGSAYFNGDAVEVDLEIAPEDTGVFVAVAGGWVATEDPRRGNSCCRSAQTSGTLAARTPA